uniref:Uncharacterized protein n=1 Tax=Plectus sambesii TaxID=2011161 RepID=A0A914VIT7_9BILA
MASPVLARSSRQYLTIPTADELKLKRPTYPFLPSRCYVRAHDNFDRSGVGDVRRAPVSPPLRNRFRAFLRSPFRRRPIAAPVASFVVGRRRRRLVGRRQFSVAMEPPKRPKPSRDVFSCPQGFSDASSRRRSSGGAVFDTFDVANETTTPPSQGGGLLLPQHHGHHHSGTGRRESFLYRADSDFECTPRSVSRASSVASSDLM